MADYWKSQPRKFCQYCKCWIADNKPSIEFHERGKNHKENVTAKISEIKKKSVAKAKQEERMSKDFATMEEAALKAYEEDLKRMEREAAGLDAPVQTTTKIQLQPKPQVKIQVKPHGKKHHKNQKANKKPRDQTKTQIWVEGQTDGGNKYYYNTVTGESHWEKPDGFQGVASASEQPPIKSSSGGLWLEAVSPDGYTYYYNPDTGESIWEKPASILSKEASRPDQEGKSQGEPSTPQPPSGADESSNKATASQEAEVSKETNESHTAPTSSFKKRKIEVRSPEKKGKDEVGENAHKEEADETKKEEEDQNKTAESEKKEEVVTQRVTQARRPKAANPYGAWERIKEVVDPYSKVDLQLPKFEKVSTSAPAVLPAEPKPKFKERIITSLGEEGGPTSFRKSKTQGGKSRSLRQRDNDD